MELCEGLRGCDVSGYSVRGGLGWIGRARPESGEEEGREKGRKESFSQLIHQLDIYLHIYIYIYIFTSKEDAGWDTRSVS